VHPATRARRQAIGRGTCARRECCLAWRLLHPSVPLVHHDQSQVGCRPRSSSSRWYCHRRLPTPTRGRQLADRRSSRCGDRRGIPGDRGPRLRWRLACLLPVTCPGRTRCRGWRTRRRSDRALSSPPGSCRRTRRVLRQSQQRLRWLLGAWQIALACITRGQRSVENPDQAARCRRRPAALGCRDALFGDA